MHGEKLYFLIISFTLPVININPKSQEAYIGDNIKVAIEIENVTDLYAFQFSLDYSTDTLQLINITEGGFLNNAININCFDYSTQGKIVYQCNRKEQIGINGAGILAIINFKVINQGVSKLTIPEITLTGSDLQEVIPADTPTANINVKTLIPSLSVWDSSDTQTIHQEEEITFYAAYTNLKTGNPLVNATCKIYFNDSSFNMKYNFANELYEYTTSFSEMRTSNYRVSCDDLNVDDTYTIISSCVDIDKDGYGKYSNIKCPHQGIDCDDSNSIIHPHTIELCNDGIDNNCDSESDYDSKDRKHGDKNCKVSITTISLSTNKPYENELINISCTTNVANINSVKAYIDDKECVWTDNISKWEGKTAIFVGCNVGDSGTKNVKCTIDSTRSYQKGSDKTTTIEVLSSECNKYTTLESCPSSICEWVPKCDGYKWNGLVEDSCVNKGISSIYQCNVYQTGETGNSCGSTCDDSIGCEATICDNYCSGNTLYVRNDITNYCDTKSRCSCSSVSCEIGTPQSCGTTSCDITKHLVGSCDNPCNEAGTKNDGTDARCGRCTPIFPDDCACEPGWYDINNIIEDGCEYKCSPTGEDVCGNNIDEDCDGIDATCPTPLTERPLKISNIKATDISSNSTIIKWITNKPSTSKVEYGTTDLYGSIITLNKLVISHYIELNNLKENKVYHYRITSEDSNNNEIVSGDLTFKTKSAIQICKLINVYWDQDRVLEGEIVNITIETINCKGEVLLLELIEDDGIFGTTKEDIDLGFVKIRNNKESKQWQVKWSKDLGGITIDPEYFLKATLKSDNKTVIKSNILKVSKSDRDNDNIPDTIDCNFNDANIGECKGCAVCKNKGENGSCVAVDNLCNTIPCPKNTCGGGNCSLDTRAIYKPILNTHCELNGSIGSCLPLKCEPIKCVPNKECTIDSDNDGIPNKDDKCPGTITRRVNIYGCPVPFYKRFTPELTTNFSAVDLFNITYFRIGIANRAKIEFTGFINLYKFVKNYSEVFDLDKHINISYSKVEVDSKNLPQLNVSSRITMYNISYVNPIILRDNETCDECNVTGYDRENHTLIFTIPHYTTYSVVEGPYCGDDICGTNETCSSCSLDCGRCSERGVSTTSTECENEWYCTDWGKCTNGYQTRVCTDINNCDSSTNKPDESRKCEIVTSSVAPSCTDGIKNGDEIGIDCGGSCEECIIDEEKVMLEILAKPITLKILDSIDYKIVLKNKGNRPVKDIFIELDIPSAWGRDITKSYKELKENDEIELSFELNIPAQTEEKPEVKLSVFSKDKLLTAELLPINVRIPEFLVAVKKIPLLNKGDVYMIINNKVNQKRTGLEIEYRIDKANKTYVAEHIGPFSAGAYKTEIKKKSISLSEFEKGVYEVKGVLYEKGRIVGEVITKLDLKEQEPVKRIWSLSTRWLYYSVITFLILSIIYLFYPERRMKRGV
jgi:hypothetical protein